MKLNSIGTGIGLLLSASLASATVTADFGSYSVTYDETTSFGFITNSFAAGGGAVGFYWNFDPSVQITSVGGGAVSSNFALPDFTIMVNPGFTLNGPLTGSIGNLFYAEFGGAVTSITTASTVSVDGGPALALPPTLVGKVSTGPTLGYFADSATAPLGVFTSFAVTASSITLAASGGSFAVIGAQPQNELAFTFTANPVPEPETYAMLLAGMGVIGWVARRRRQG